MFLKKYFEKQDCDEIFGSSEENMSKTCITSYLTGRPQRNVLIRWSVFLELRKETTSSTFLFTLYTPDFQDNSWVRPSAEVLGRIKDGREGEPRAVVYDFVERAGRNHLLLNVAKTKKMVVDFRRKNVKSSGRGCGRGGGVQLPETPTYKLVRKAGSISGCKLDSLEEVLERKTLKKLSSILDNPPTLSTFQDGSMSVHVHISGLSAS